MKIVWSPLAVERLECIRDYIMEDNISVAEDTINAIFNKVETLLENSERGRVVPEVCRENIREVIHGDYRIIYKLEFDRVIILTIRNFKQLLPEIDISDL